MTECGLQYGLLEVIDGLCKATDELSKIVRRQDEELSQAAISAETIQEIASMRDAADDDLDALEYKMRHIR